METAEATKEAHAKDGNFTATSAHARGRLQRRSLSRSYMQRNEWTFQYPADVVLEGAKRRVEYHRQRDAFWTAERDNSKAAIKDHGIEIREVEATVNRLDRTVDKSLERRYAEAIDKQRRHSARAEEYEAWCRVLELNRHAHLLLDYDDLKFFAL